MGFAKHKYYFCRQRSPTVCQDRSKIHFMRSKPPITVNSVEWISGKLSVRRVYRNQCCVVFTCYDIKEIQRLKSSIQCLLSKQQLILDEKR